jgi:hypothetical protein
MRLVSVVTRTRWPTAGALFDFAQQVIHLPFGGAHFHFGVQHAGGANHLAHNFGRMFQLKRSGGGAGENGLIDALAELVEVERPVIQGAGQAEAVINQGLFAAAVAGVHAAHLGQGHVALIHHQQVVGREIVEQRPGRIAFAALVHVAAVVFDAGGVAHFAQHFQVIHGALLDALGFQEHFALFEEGDALAEFGFDVVDGLGQFIFVGDKLAGGEDLMLVRSRSTSPVRAPRIR